MEIYHTFVSVAKPQLVSSASHILDSCSAFSDIRHWMEKSYKLSIQSVAKISRGDGIQNMRII